MNCPKCKELQNCPCKNCATRNNGKIVYIWHTSNGPIECGYCGHSMSIIDWEAEGYRQYQEFVKLEENHG